MSEILDQFLNAHSQAQPEDSLQLQTQEPQGLQFDTPKPDLGSFLAAHADENKQALRDRANQLVRAYEAGDFSPPDEWRDALYRASYEGTTPTKTALEYAKGVGESLANPWGIIKDVTNLGTGAVKTVAKGVKEQVTQPLDSFAGSVTGAYKGLASTVSLAAHLDQSIFAPVRSPEDRMQDIIGAGNVSHNIAVSGKMVSEALGGDKAPASEAIGEFGGQMAPFMAAGGVTKALSIPSKIAPRVAEGVVEKAVPKAVGAAARVVGSPVTAAAGAAATGHPLIALEGLAASYAPEGMKGAGILDWLAIKPGKFLKKMTLDKVDELGQKLMGIPSGITIARKGQMDLLEEIASNQKAEQIFKLGSKVDEAALNAMTEDQLKVLGYTKELKIKGLQAERQALQAKYDRLGKWNQLGMLSKDVAKLGVSTGLTAAAGGATVGAFGALDAIPDDVKEATKQGFTMGVALTAPALLPVGVATLAESKVGRLKAEGDFMAGRGQKFLSGFDDAGQMSTRLPTAMKRRIDITNGAIGSSGNKVLAVEPSILRAKLGLPNEAELPNGYFDAPTGTAYVNADALRQGVWVQDHEIGHVIDQVTDWAMTKAYSTIMDGMDNPDGRVLGGLVDFFTNYENAVKIKMLSRWQIPRMMQEGAAELARYILARTPMEQIFSGKDVWDVLADKINRAKLSITGGSDEVFKVLGFEAPAQQKQIDALKDVLYKYGQQAQKGMIAPAVLKSDAPVIDPEVARTVGAGLIKFNVPKAQVDNIISQAVRLANDPKDTNDVFRLAWQIAQQKNKWMPTLEEKPVEAKPPETEAEKFMKRGKVDYVDEEYGPVYTDEQGRFMPAGKKGFNLEKPPAPEVTESDLKPEPQIMEPAVYATGWDKPVYAFTHADAIKKAKGMGLDTAKAEKGYYTLSGTFLPTKQAMEYGQEIGQLPQEMKKMSDMDFQGYRQFMPRVNIGLNVGDKLGHTPEEVIKALEDIGVKVLQSSVHHPEGGEPTVVATLSRALRPDEAHKVSIALDQESIAQHNVGPAGGELYGPQADKWRPFNSDYFINHEGKPLTEELKARPTYPSLSSGLWDRMTADPNFKEGRFKQIAEDIGVPSDKRFFEQKPADQQKIKDYFKGTGEAQFMPALSKEDHYNAAEDFMERNDRGVDHIAQAFLNNKGKVPFNWPTVKADRLKKIWGDFGRSGVVRDVKGLEAIKDQVLNNIAMLRASTDIMGHSMAKPSDIFENSGYDFTDKQIDKIGDFLTDKHGNYMLSDYGLPQLEKLYSDLYHADTPEGQLYAIDKILNVIHARSDLSAMFVEGGNRTLTEIAQQGGYTSQDQMQYMPAMYSRAGKELAKMTQDKFDAEQLKGMFVKRGIPKAEMEWLGLNDLQGKVTKQQVLDTIAANTPKLEEVALGVPRVGNISGARAVQMGRETQYETPALNLPGGENYRELLYKLPPKMVSKPTGRSYKIEPVNPEEQPTLIREGITHQIVDAKSGAPYFSGNKGDVETMFKHQYENQTKVVPERETLYTSPHFGETEHSQDLVAHARVDDRVDPVTKGKMLFAQEMQSDWAQKARKGGVLPKDLSAKIASLEKQYNDLTGVSINKEAVAIPFESMSDNDVSRAADIRSEWSNLKDLQESGVPDMPFMGQGWKKLLLRKLIMHGVDQGYDSIGWTTGEQQAARYDLSKYVDSIQASKTLQDNYNLDLIKDGETIQSISKVPESELSNHAGKDIAQKIVQGLENKVAGHPITLSGLDLEVGGEGMKGFYDKELVNIANDIGKKFGARVEDADVGAGKYKLYNDRGMGWVVEDSSGNTVKTFDDQNYAKKWIKDNAGLTVHRLPITDAMRESVGKEGMPMFMPRTPDSPQFRRWFGDSKAVDENGKPIPLFHGTTQDFNEFKNFNAESDWGKAIYLSNSPRDVETNYATREGADITNRIERLADNISQERDIPFKDAKKEAISKLTSHGGAIMPLYAKMENPLELGGKRGEYWDMDYGDESGEPSGKIVDFANALDNAATRYDSPIGPGRDFLENNMDGGRASDILQNIKESDLMLGVMDNEGNMAGNDLIKEAIRDMGYDGIIDHTVNDKFGTSRTYSAGLPGMDENTTHYIVFDPTQVKSATGNVGTFDPGVSDIRFMPSTIESAKALSSAGEKVSTNVEDEFFGKIWPNLLKKTKLTVGPGKDANVRVAAERAVGEVSDWLKNNSRFKDYYSKDYQTARDLLDHHLGSKITDEEFKLFQVMNGIFSNQTPLQQNTAESIQGLELFRRQGNFDGITTFVNPETGNRKMGESPFSISSSSAPNKAFAIGVINQLIKDKGGVEGAIKFLQEEVPSKELNQFNQSVGYKSKTITNLPSIREVVQHATGQSEKIPRIFVFGKKVGAYSLNSLGDHRYNTIDTWESRFIRSYFKGLWEKQKGIAGGDEHELFSKFVTHFNEIYRRDIDPNAESSALQAARWYYILDAAKQVGYNRSITNQTISEYVQKYFNKETP